MEKIIDFAHSLLKKRVSKDDYCVDMTIGNGNDTLFLASISKFVYGFDIQQVAINNTNKLLIENNYSNYKLIMSSHENIKEFIEKKIKAFIFNLGYLPTGDKNITTNAATTLKALREAFDLLKSKGIIVMVLYPGHSNGKIEADELIKFTKQLNQKEFDVVTYKFINQVNNPPFLLIIEKRN
ncbi:MAG: class I SAM-dependent methyltransferase [Candidatus Caccosoma sp.]|nr:class I SAM-dependent methyltransferase [Candidatus Caccosoma sp.]